MSRPETTVTEDRPARPAPEPFRVAMVIQRFRPAFSGHGIQVEDLCRALARRGVEPSIVTAAPQGDLAGEERAGPVRVERLRPTVGLPLPASLAARLRSPIFAARTLARLLRRRGGVDLVHVHARTDALYAAWAAARLLGIPIVFEMTLLGADDAITLRDGGDSFARARFAVFRRCDGYVAISPALARRYAEAGMPAERLRVIPQGVDLERFRPAADRAAARRALELPADAPVLAFVGSLALRKGIDVLLAAWARIHAARPDARLVLVGQGEFPDDPAAGRPLAEGLAALPPAAAAAVRRAGLRDDAERFLQVADAFLFPSRREGFGTAIVEAMACGLPCVVAVLSGITDFIFGAAAPMPSAAGGDADGIVVPQEDPGALADAALELLADATRAAAIGRAARTRAAARFGFDVVASAYLDFYGQLRRGRS